ESPDLGAVLPGVARQTGFMAGLLEQLEAIPLPFGRDLRQQQPPVPAHLDDETMTADRDLARIAHRLERTEHGDFYVEVRQLAGADRRKPRIGAACGNRAVGDHVCDWAVGLDVAD